MADGIRDDALRKNYPPISCSLLNISKFRFNSSRLALIVVLMLPWAANAQDCNPITTYGGNAYTGTLTDAERQAIGGQKLTNVAPPTYDYIDINGTGATHAAVVIDADNMPTSLSGWYIVQGTVNYTSRINLAGDTHIILADGAVMNVETSSYGISGNNFLFVYGQTGQSGELNVSSSSLATYIAGGDITIAGGKVTTIGSFGIYTEIGSITINGGQVTATGNDFGIYAFGGSVTINGGQVTASGTRGIFAEKHNNSGGNVTIQNATVTATGSNIAILSYNGDITINNSNVTATGTGLYGIYAETSGNILLNGGKITANGSSYGIFCYNGVTIESGQVEITGGSDGIEANNITLGWTNATDYIYANSYIDKQGDPITLTKTFIDEASNTYSGAIEQVSGAYAINGKTLRPCIGVTMNGNGIRTYASEYDLDFSNVSGLTAYVATNISGNTLMLNSVGKVPGGTGLLLKGTAGETFNVNTTGSATAINSNLLVGLTEATEVYQTTDDGIAFILANGDHGINWYKLAETSYTLNANSAYLRLPASVAPNASRALTMRFEETTGIVDADLKSASHESGISNPLQRDWYSLDGVRLSGKPTKKGVYVVGGRKIVVK